MMVLKGYVNGDPRFNTGWRIKGVQAFLDGVCCRKDGLGPEPEH